MADWKVPFGKAKGSLITEASAQDLAWVRDKIAEKLAADPDKAYADKDRAFIAAADAELTRRGSGGAAAPKPAQAPAPERSIQRAAEVQIVSGAFRDPQRATTALRQASSLGHLVAPAPVCGALPEGCSLAIAAVQVDAANETYELPGGKRGLGKVALDKIAAAAGISWDPNLSRRLDDGSDPHYCHYKAVGRVRDFDGTVRVLQGEVEIDAREGSPLLEEIRTKAEKRRARNPSQPNDGGDSQILELRKFLLRHAESKAKNRAIRSLGVRTSYTGEELQKPFVVAKVQFTGESSDPALRRMFAEKTAEAFLGSSAALYGPQPAALPPTAPPALHAPPPVGNVGAEEYDYEADGEPRPPSTPRAETPAAAAPPAAPAEDWDRGPDANAY
jgi:hypothetical protein